MPEIRWIKVDIPTSDGEVSGYSCNGINVYGDKKSMEFVRLVIHSHETYLPHVQNEFKKFRQEYDDLVIRLRKLVGELETFSGP